MKLHHALELLGIRPDATQQELTRAFRLCVKRFHPDYNPDRPEWSNNMMAQVNAAYEAVRLHLQEEEEEGGAGLRNRAEGYRRDGGNRQTAGNTGRARTADRRGQPRSTGAAGETGGQTKRTADSGPEYYAAYDEPLKPEFIRAFTWATELLLEGVFRFYQYGLENVHLRRQGNLRSRYQGALRRVDRAVRQLEAISPDNLNKHEEQRRSLTLQFAYAFSQNMRIDKFFVPTGPALDTKAYRHYRRGSELLDSVIKQSLFGSSFVSRKGGLSIGESSHAGEHELLTLLTRYHESHWATEAVLKLQLLSAVLELYRAGILR